MVCSMHKHGTWKKSKETKINTRDEGKSWECLDCWNGREKNRGREILMERKAWDRDKVIMKCASQSIEGLNARVAYNSRYFRSETQDRHIRTLQHANRYKMLTWYIIQAAVKANCKRLKYFTAGSFFVTGTLAAILSLALLQADNKITHPVRQSSLRRYVSQPVKNSPKFMKYKGSSPCSQHPCTFPIPSNINQVHNFQSYFVRFILILPSDLCLGLSICLFPEGYPHQNSACSSLLPHTCHMLC